MRGWHPIFIPRPNKMKEIVWYKKWNHVLQEHLNSMIANWSWQRNRKRGRRGWGTAKTRRGDVSLILTHKPHIFQTFHFWPFLMPITNWLQLTLKCQSDTKWHDFWIKSKSPRSHFNLTATLQCIVEVERNQPLEAVSKQWVTTVRQAGGVLGHHEPTRCSRPEFLQAKNSDGYR